jgi:hypothetical protein
MRPENESMLPVVRAAELDAAEPGRHWLVEPLWARAGVGIIGGHPKLGKSWLGLDLAISVASGTPCLDCFPVADPGAVLLYMAEDAAPVVKQRLEGICRHRGLDLAALPIGVITAPSMRLDLPHDQRRLAATVRCHAPRLLVLDPFVRLHRINENQASDVAAVLGYLRELQRTHDLAVTVVHHARKNGSASGGQCLRGSGDFFAWVDTALSLRRQRHQLVLSVEHRSAGAPQPLQLALAGTEQDMHLAIVADRASADHRTPPAATQDLDTAVLDALGQAGHSGLPRGDLRQALRVRNQRLGEVLQRLTTAGSITRNGEAWVRRSIPAPPPIHTPREPEREPDLGR